MPHAPAGCKGRFGSQSGPRRGLTDPGGPPLASLLPPSSWEEERLLRRYLDVDARIGEGPESAQLSRSRRVLRMQVWGIKSGSCRAG
jgi:hypothetical protein